MSNLSFLFFQKNSKGCCSINAECFCLPLAEQFARLRCLVREPTPHVKQSGLGARESPVEIKIRILNLTSGFVCEMQLSFFFLEVPRWAVSPLQRNFPRTFERGNVFPKTWV